MVKRPQDLSSFPPSDLLDLPLGGDLSDSAPQPPQPPQQRAGDIEAIGSLDRRGRPPRKRGSWLWLILLMAFPIGGLTGYFLSSEPPVVVLSEDLLDFGEVRLGRSGDERVLRVANHGEETLWVANTALNGDASAEFNIVSNGCAGLEIDALEECEVRLSFRPTTGGPRRSQLRFDSNAINGPQTVSLSGVGVRPKLNVEPAQLDFGRQVVGRGGASADLRIDNRGTAPLQLGRLGLEGDSGADFLRVADDCGSRDLAPGGRCVVRFTFVPRAPGERRATVRIESDASNQPISIPLFGRGLDRTPVLRLDLERLDFGGLPVGEASPNQAVGIANDGAGPLIVRRLQVTELPYGEVFQIVSESCTIRPVAPGGACEIKIRFQPADESSAQSYLRIEAAGEPVQVSLTGFGTAPHARIEPSRLSFGDVSVRAVSAPRVLRVANTGGADLVLGEIQATGSDAASFASQGCSGTVVPPGAECVAEVFFRPRRAGPHRAELIVRHNADDRRQQIRLNGLGAASSLALDPGEVDFGDVVLDTPSRRRLELRSSGRSSLEIRRLRLTGSGSGSEFKLAEDRCSNKTLPPARTCSVLIVFQPTSAGIRNIRLEIEHSGGTTQVPIRASAIE